MKASRKVILSIALVVVLLLLVTYIGGMFYFNKKYLPGTQINGIAYGGKSYEDVEKKLANPPTDQVTVTGKEGVQATVSLSPEHYTVTLNQQDLEQIAHQQSLFSWPFRWLMHNEYQVDRQVELNEEKIKQSVDQLSMFSEKDMIAPVDAHIEETADDYQIIPEVEGNQINKAAAYDHIVEAIRQGQDTVDLVATGSYNEPEVVADDPKLQELLVELQALGKLEITYDFADRQESLNYETFSDWVTYDVKKGIQVEEEQAEAYVKQLAASYDTYYTNRLFQATGIGQITVGGGIYGWQTDIPATTEQLIGLIEQGESAVVEPIYKIRGLHRTRDDIGNTYIEIDLTRQVMWYYVNGEVYAETGIVSGLPVAGRETPTGIGSVWSKEEKRYISGENYKFWVEYWMPVDWSGVGIHDAPWQSNFGGSQYLVSGSHGCINTPYENVARIYNHVQINTPVVIYKS